MTSEQVAGGLILAPVASWLLRCAVDAHRARRARAFVPSYEAQKTRMVAACATQPATLHVKHRRGTVQNPADPSPTPRAPR